MTDPTVRLQPLVRARIAEDLRQHTDPAHTPHLGAFVAMLSVYGEVSKLQGAGVLSARSRAVDLGRWQSFFNSAASGPPGFRVRQLLALSRAGFVDFLGPGMWVEVADDESKKVVDAIEAVKTDARDKPLEDVVLESVTIDEV